jgi:hypothetical protein
MPTSTVYNINPVFSTISSNPSVSGAGGASDILSDSGSDGGGNALVVFSKAAYGVGTRGGPVPSYAVSVTLPATVTPKSTPTLLNEGAYGEQRPLAEMRFEVSTDVDPGTALGAPLVTDDLMVWAGLNLFVIGTAYPSGSGYVTLGRLTT